MSLTAFVTGATGFVGSHLVRALCDQGWTVHLLARPSSPLDEIRDLPFEKHLGDVTDAESVMKAVPRGVDGVFHVAASTNFWSRRNDEQTRINVDGTRHVLEAAIDAGARRFIHTSSFVSWGFTDSTIDEESSRTSSSDWINYVRTKHLSEQLVLQAAREKRVDAVVLNPANVLGPGDRHNWSRLFRLIHERSLPGAPPGGGNFCDVREVARAHVRAWHDGDCGRRYLLGGEFARIIDVIAIAGELLDRPVPRRPMPAWVLKTSARLLTALAELRGREPDLTPESAEMTSHDIVCDSGLAERELGYRSVPLRDMIRDTIDWMKEKDLLS
jgi:nucleoside-diphosphate-sugar epimerase